MTNDQVQSFLLKKQKLPLQVHISFRKRDAFNGLFIQLIDFEFLKRKNLWRIVGEANLEAYAKTKDESLARIFNGIEFTRLV